MPRFDFRCTQCERVRPDVWVSNFRDASGTFDASQLAPCETCGGRSWEKIPATPSFTIRGFSARNGYSNGRG